MNLLSISNLSKIGREKPLFTAVTFGLQEGEKAALIGRNGCGKSTLLNTIAGLLPADEGSVVINKDAGISFLPQNPLYKEEDTIRQHIFKSESQKLNIIRQYLEICNNLNEKNQNVVFKVNLKDYPMPEANSNDLYGNLRHACADRLVCYLKPNCFYIP